MTHPTTDASGAGLSFAQRVLAAQPFNDVVGARITRFAAGEAILEVDIDDRHRQQAGLVHGGVIAYLVDNTLTFACGTVLGAALVTGGMTVTYLKGARTGCLSATARVVAHDRRRAVATVTVEEIGPDGTVTTCAAGKETLSPLRPSCRSSRGC